MESKSGLFLEIFPFTEKLCCLLKIRKLLILNVPELKTAVKGLKFHNVSAMNKSEGKPLVSMLRFFVESEVKKERTFITLLEVESGLLFQ